MENKGDEGKVLEVELGEGANRGKNVRTVKDDFKIRFTELIFQDCYYTRRKLHPSLNRIFYDR